MNPLGPLLLCVGVVVLIITVLVDRKHASITIDLIFGAGFILVIVGFLIILFGEAR